MENLSTFSKLIKINKNIILLIILVFTTSIFTLYSAAGGSFFPWASKQLTYFLLFFPLFIFITLVNINFWAKLAYPIYFGALLLLIYVEFMGHTAMGATRWIRFAGLSLQPSETMKLGLVMGLARYFSSKSLEEIKQIKYSIVPLLMIFIPALLVLKQPDLGTAMILISIGVGILFVVGIQWWKFAICALICLLFLPIAWKYGLHDYQKKRVEVFLNPESDPLGSGYNITQSKIAIGSGGFFGKGYLQGTQSHLSFLPEKQTDFIFTMYTEEMGFVGGFYLVSLYLIVIAIIFWIAFKSKYTYGRIIASGMGFIIFFHVFINIGMVMGILPVVGVPLPLMSYGGTITVSTLLAFGFIMNADLYKNEELKTKQNFIIKY